MKWNGGWPAYVSVAERRKHAMKKVADLKKKGYNCQPIKVEGRTIAHTFWGKAWCTNLEAYSDLANRLPRGRTYVRNGSVVDLSVESGRIKALVMGSSLYEITISIKPLADDCWQAIRRECAEKVSSLVELLQGRLSQAVMEVVTRHGVGLFPHPNEITMKCSCPDSAYLCKHLAATLYGVGVRLDAQPDLLFKLRQVDAQELIWQAPVLAPYTPDRTPELEGANLSELFGIELDADNTSATSTTRSKNLAPQIKTSELTIQGIPYHIIQNWLDSGVLVRTKERGVYQTTQNTEKCIAEYLQRRNAAK